MNPKEHWEKVYREKDPVTDVSWFQATPANSLELILATGVGRGQPLIDIGGGASVLADRLLEAGFEGVTVLDISGAALKHAQKRLGARAGAVNWLEADASRFEPPHSFQVWHDRAVFHFLTKAADRQGYVRALKKAVPAGGHVILATFALDGPQQCSGLPVARYDAESISSELGPEFQLIEQRRESHFTPWNTEQRFIWFRFQRRPVGAASIPDLRANQTGSKAGAPALKPQRKPHLKPHKKTE